MKTIRELEDKLLEKMTERKEIASSYKELDINDDSWRGKRLTERWHRADEAISLLKWILNSENENGGKKDGQMAASR